MCIRDRYSIVFNFPSDATCSHTYLVSQFGGIGTVYCKYLSETYSQNFFGNSITKYSTLPSYSSNMDDLETSLKTYNNFSPKTGKSVNYPI